MLKLTDKYFAITPTNDPHSVVDINGYTYRVCNSEHYYCTLDKAKEAYLKMTGEPYIGMNNPTTRYYIIEIKITLETNRI